MQSGDGLLVRVRTAARALTTHEVRALSALARTYGNGQIELTRRANLQLRGIEESALPQLTDALCALGLLAHSLALEERLGLMVSPLAGIDARCAALPQLGAALERTLLAADLPAMPSKFGMVLDAEPGALAQVFADVRIECAGELAHLSVAGDRASALPLGASALADVPAAVLRLVQRYAALGSDARHDAPAWLAAVGSHELRTQLADYLIAAPPPAATCAVRESWLGAHEGWFGVGIPFGSATAELWLELVSLAEHHGCAQLRVTPWRALLLIGRPDTPALARDAAQLGLLVQPGDALERVDACPGAPACTSALGETRALARALAPMLAPDATLHVSGCSKGCAHRGPASVTLLQDSGGCRVGFDLDSAQTSTGKVVPLSEARAQLRVWRDKRGEVITATQLPS